MFKKNLLLALFVYLLLLIPIYSQNNGDSIIQMAILLDTSSSMDGLIDQAKSQLWKIVNELALSKKNGISPKLEVALYEYGNDNLPKSKGFIRLVSPLTTDLDLISEKLFSLTTYGGLEYCGQVIKDAVDKLEWSKDNKILKLIFIAGNEPFDQGNINYKLACKSAISKGIIVNTIFCGDAKYGIGILWKDGADLADGKYISIDQNIREVYVEAPQDKDIQKLNDELNKTYIYYGSDGADKKTLQEKQDTNAKGLNMEAFIQRSVTKSKSQYNNSSWDMVDAANEQNFDISKIKDEELPPEMKKMTKDERAKYLDAQTQKRKEIKNKIEKLNKERIEYITQKKRDLLKDDTLDSAIIKSIREQAKSKDYQF